MMAINIVVDINLNSWLIILYSLFVMVRTFKATHFLKVVKDENYYETKYLICAKLLYYLNYSSK